MAMIISPESELGKELAKWEKPWRYERFPQSLYKAFKRDNGRVECMEAPPPMHLYLSMPEYQRAEAVAKAFTDQCQKTVRNEQEYDRARAEGWQDTAPLALAHFEALEREIADAAAEAIAKTRSMTAKAQAEFAAAEADTDAHVVDVTPKTSHKKKEAH